MNRSAARVTRPKKKKVKLEASFKIYPFNCREIEEDYAGQHIAYLVGLRKGKAIWKIVAHDTDIVRLNRAIDKLPASTQRKILLHYATDPNDPVLHVHYDMPGRL